MIAEYRNKAIIGLSAGILLEVVGFGAANGSKEIVAIIGKTVGFLGEALSVWGCANLCIARGNPKWLGVLGLISCFGVLLIFLYLPDNFENTQPPID